MNVGRLPFVLSRSDNSQNSVCTNAIYNHGGVHVTDQTELLLKYLSLYFHVCHTHETEMLCWILQFFLTKYDQCKEIVVIWNAMHGSTNTGNQNWQYCNQWWYQHLHHSENLTKPIIYKWDEIFKNGASKISGRQALTTLKWYGLLKHTISLQIFYGCLPQISFGPFLNTLSRM